ncbi:MAG: pseudouridine synthase [Thermodesulfobacteriota bacterium]
MTKVRLQKFLAHAGICSRRAAEKHIIEGRVVLNNEVVSEMGVKVDPDRDVVWFDGRRVENRNEDRNVYIALNKPRGYVSSCSHKGDKIVLDLIDIPERIYPVGRLDKDSQGLILLTNDGFLHNRLSHPSYNHGKKYLVTTFKSLSDRDLKQLEEGVVIEKEKTRKAQTRRVSKNRFIIILRQGRNRQIRKMVEKIGNEVKSLKRIGIADIRLGDLKEGKWRHLTSEEVKKLYE